MAPRSEGMKYLPLLSPEQRSNCLTQAVNYFRSQGQETVGHAILCNKQEEFAKIEVRRLVQEYQRFIQAQSDRLVARALDPRVRVTITATANGPAISGHYNDHSNNTTNYHGTVGAVVQTGTVSGSTNNTHNGPHDGPAVSGHGHTITTGDNTYNDRSTVLDTGTHIRKRARSTDQDDDDEPERKKPTVAEIIDLTEADATMTRSPTRSPTGSPTTMAFADTMPMVHATMARAREFTGMPTVLVRCTPTELLTAHDDTMPTARQGDLNISSAGLARRTHTGSPTAPTVRANAMPTACAMVARQGESKLARTGGAVGDSTGMPTDAEVSMRVMVSWSNWKLYERLNEIRLGRGHLGFDEWKAMMMREGRSPQNPSGK